MDSLLTRTGSHLQSTEHLPIMSYWPLARLKGSPSVSQISQNLLIGFHGGRSEHVANQNGRNTTFTVGFTRVSLLTYQAEGGMQITCPTNSEVEAKSAAGKHFFGSKIAIPGRVGGGSLAALILARHEVSSKLQVA